MEKRLCAGETTGEIGKTFKAMELFIAKYFHCTKLKVFLALVLNSCSFLP